MIELSDDSFNAVTGTTERALVYFWSPRCSHCLQTAPVVEQVSEHYMGQPWFLKVQVDTNLQTSLENDIQFLPTVVALVDGKEVSRFTGTFDQEYLKTFVQKFLS